MDERFLQQAIQRYTAAMFLIDRKLTGMIRELVPSELTVEQYKVLSYIRVRGKCTSSELADAFCVGKSSVTAIITRLVDKKWIRRMPDEKDRRVIALSLTGDGERVAKEIDRKIEEVLAGYLNHFTDEEASQFLATYEKLAQALRDS